MKQRLFARGIFAAWAALGLLACGPTVRTVPPLGEVLVVVDTDMPVPRIVSRLRVDFYTLDHVWYGTRDLSRAKVSDWPVSFGVHVPDATTEREVIVRLRAYPQGELRDYRGERYTPRATSGAPFDETPVPEPTNEPRLRSEENLDVTPSTEPAPAVTIDRLVRVRVKPGTRAAARIVLRGECIGTMADLANDTTCIELENERVAMTEEPLTSDLALPSSLVGSFGSTERCTATPRAASQNAEGAPLYDDEVCVDGAMFILGTNNGFGFGGNKSSTKRVAILPPFRIDRFEVTVGRWRDALSKGFAPPREVVVNDTPIPREGSLSTDPRSCTFSTAPMGREDHPMTCLSSETARAFCKWSGGGDLPTEAQWEYVAMEAGRPSESPFPWGGNPGIAATCAQAAFGRGALSINNECNKDATHYGVVSITEHAATDVSLGLGLVGLAGNVSEMLLDSYASISSNCWSLEPLRAPACRAPSALRTSRGASWAAPSSAVFSAYRAPFPVDGASAEIGFRCVRSGG